MTEHWPDSLMAASAIGVSYMSAVISFRGAVNPAWALGRAFVVNNFKDLWVRTFFWLHQELKECKCSFIYSSVR